MKLNIKKESYRYASYVLGVPITTLQKTVDTIYTITSNDIQSHPEINYMGGTSYFDMYSTDTKFYALSYINSTSADIFRYEVGVIIFVYLSISQNLSSDVISYVAGSYIQKLGKAEQYEDDVRTRMKQLLNSMRDYYEYTYDIKLSFLANYSSIEKDLKIIKKKFNIKSEIKTIRIDRRDRAVIIFTWKDLSVGNDVEGYIKYKTLSLYISVEDGNVKRVDITFPNKMQLQMIKHDISLPFHPHPHISGHGTVCAGNMTDYIENLFNTKPESWLIFLAGIYDEIVTGYNAGDEEAPYISITKLQMILKRAEEIWETSDKSLPGTDLMNSRVDELYEEEPSESEELDEDDHPIEHIGEEEIIDADQTF